MSDNSVIGQLLAHRSIRRFSDRPVEDATLESLVAAAQCAATSHHVQAYAIIQVEDRANRAAIAHLSGPQAWVEQAPVFLVFCADLTRLVRAAEAHGTTAGTGWAEQFIVATVDTALVAQNLMTAAESQGLGGVFIGGIRNDPDQVATLLRIPDLAYPVFGMCLGYPDQDPPPKPRLPLSLVLRKDSFQGAGPESHRTDGAYLKDYDQTLAAYYKSRDTNLKTTTWTEQMTRFMAQQTRPHMKAFLEKRGFFLR